jgi:predicted aminopeptidase
MRERKHAEFEGLKSKLAGQERYRNLVPNNAFLASFATYTDLVPTYEHMLREEGGDLERFYARVKNYASRPPAERGPLSQAGGRQPAGRLRSAECRRSS